MNEGYPNFGSIGPYDQNSPSYRLAVQWFESKREQQRYDAVTAAIVEEQKRREQRLTELAVESAKRQLGDDTIPPEFRTHVMTMKEAAKLLRGKGGKQDVAWLRTCIDDGRISAIELSRQQYIFDRRQLPEKS